MKKSRIWLYLPAALLGALALYLGGFVFVSDDVKEISGLCLGAGAAAFCLGLGNLIGALIISKAKNEELTRKKNIEVHDERNIRIREKVGAKINQVTVYALSAVVLIMGLAHAALWAIILLSSVFLLQLVLAVALTGYYAKRM